MCFLPCKNGNEKEMLLETLLANETEQRAEVSRQVLFGPKKW